MAGVVVEVLQQQELVSHVPLVEVVLGHTIIMARPVVMHLMEVEVLAHRPILKEELLDKQILVVVLVEQVEVAVVHPRVALVVQALLLFAT